MERCVGNFGEGVEIRRKVHHYFEDDWPGDIHRKQFDW